ncbi:MAG TPA: glycosyltransferase family 2 protein [Thermoanaerobaculia bacterium]|jgi:glycosyltransferase involved in cell wall biosynthesis
MSRPGLTAIVTTFNEEVNIQACLESLDFADEILLVDSFSTDRTVAIARAVADGRSPQRLKVVQREYFGSAAQKNWAMDQIATPWILIVDADERVPEPLAREIQRLLEAGPDAKHYFIRRENFFLGKLIRHSGWSTDKVVRLLERGAARYPNRRVHADFATQGPTPTLMHPMIHETYRSLDQALEKLHRYAVWAAADAFRAGRRPGPVELVFRPFWRFFRMYGVQAGFLDGRHGLVLCALQAYGVFLKWARVWEWEMLEKRGLSVNLPAFDETRETWEGKRENL